jgi:hypothetical protein
VTAENNAMQEILPPSRFALLMLGDKFFLKLGHSVLYFSLSRLIRYGAGQRHRSDESAESQDRSRPYRALVVAWQQLGKQLKVILDLFRGKRASPLIAASDFPGQCAEGTARTWILAVRIVHIIVDKLHEG